MGGAIAIDPATTAATATTARRGGRRKGNSVRNAYSTRRNKPAEAISASDLIHHNVGW
jgi:hypothetical protein